MSGSTANASRSRPRLFAPEASSRFRCTATFASCESSACRPGAGRLPKLALVTRSWELTRAALALSELTQRERISMTYVVTDACIKCKYMDCVEVCPVDCFYEGEVMLVINP